jgi:hypothetical protein
VNTDGTTTTRADTADAADGWRRGEEVPVRIGLKVGSLREVARGLP